MAPLGGRNLAQAADALRSWIGSQLPNASDIAVSDLEQPTTGGYSNELLFFTAAWTGTEGRITRDLVARITSPMPALFPNPDMNREFALLTALNRTDLPVPEMFWLEQDPAVLGAPFVTMERVRGRIPGDNPPYTVEGWVLELSPAEQGRLYDNGLKAVTAVSQCEWRALGLEDISGLRMPGSGETTSEERLRWAESYLEWATQGRPFPVLESALAWLKNHCPSEKEPLRLSWGDSRLGNMIFDEELNVIAALDWEQAAPATASSTLGGGCSAATPTARGLGLSSRPGSPLGIRRSAATRSSPARKFATSTTTRSTTARRRDRRDEDRGHDDRRLRRAAQLADASCQPGEHLAGGDDRSAGARGLVTSWATG